MQTDKDSYSAGETVTVTGNIIEHGTWTMEIRTYDIVLQVFDPRGMAYETGHLSLTNEGSMRYEWSFNLENSNVPGEYMIVAKSEEMSAVTAFELLNEASADPLGGSKITIDLVKERNGTNEVQNAVIKIDNSRINSEQRQYIQVVEVRSQNGVTEFLQLQTLVGNSEVSWSPQRAGDYQVRTFIIDDIDSPQKITPVRTQEIRIVE